MTRARTWVVLAMIAAGAAAIAGCRRDMKSDESTDSPPPVMPVATQQPKDHLSADELAEGPSSIYTLKLPYGFTATAHSGDESSAFGYADREKVSKYLSTRVREGKMTDYNGVTTFKGVKVPSDPNRTLDITIREIKPQGTLITVFDVTPVGTPPSQEEIYKQAGMDSKGRLLDKSKRE